MFILRCFDTLWDTLLMKNIKDLIFIIFEHLVVNFFFVRKGLAFISSEIISENFAKKQQKEIIFLKKKDNKN